MRDGHVRRSERKVSSVSTILRHYLSVKNEFWSCLEVHLSFIELPAQPINGDFRLDPSDDKSQLEVLVPLGFGVDFYT